ncbi:putative Calcium-binding EF-hand family protein [Melia azedarach]|uniref:Calcium-binding EF-hand family protein n=1 Tax=Melia azedarach TaxID=155640 RepID=A0ACC1Y3D9_MELAZ|nr:putative Calcium-binding EF-hand family protein [Melia azedarach]
MTVDKHCSRSVPWVDRNPDGWLKSYLKRCDKDADGRLGKQELKQVFQNLGSKFPGWRAWRALCYADSDGDGYIRSEDEHNLLVRYCIENGFAIE